MKTKFVALGALAGLYTLAAASQASATIVNVTVTGTITQVTELYGGDQLASVHVGDVFKAVYNFDTTQAGFSQEGANITQAIGGPGNGPSWGPFGHVDVTIGDQNYSFEGNDSGYILSETIGNSMRQFVRSIDNAINDAGAYDGIQIATYEYGTFPLDFTQSGIYDLSDGNDTASLDFYSRLHQHDGPLNFYNYVLAQLTHVEVSDGTSSDGGGSNGNSVPEPASLSLFAAGLIGASALRRRNAKRKCPDGFEGLAIRA